MPSWASRCCGGASCAHVRRLVSSILGTRLFLDWVRKLLRIFDINVRFFFFSGFYGMGECAFVFHVRIAAEAGAEADGAVWSH